MPSTSEVLAPIAIGAVEGRPESIQLFDRAIREPEHAPALAGALLAIARESTSQLEAIQEKLRNAIGPALLRGSWVHDEQLYLDVELGGAREYCIVDARDREAAELAEPGEEIVVSRVQGRAPLFVRSLCRPFETTGQHGVVLDVRKLGEGEYELEIEGQPESFSCRATRRMARAIDRGEVDALGGLPLIARHANGLVWELREKKGKAEVGGRVASRTTLEDYAGYGALRRQYCNLIGLHLLQNEPRC